MNPAVRASAGLGTAIAFLAAAPLCETGAWAMAEEAGAVISLGSFRGIPAAELAESGQMEADRLSGWSGPGFVAPAGCEARVSGALLSGRRRNHLYLAVENVSRAKLLSVSAQGAAFSIDGSEAAPFRLETASPAPSPEARLAPGARAHMVLQFPDKGAFRQASSVTVRLPVGGCFVEARFQRDRDGLEPLGRSEQAGWVSWARGELGVELGPHWVVGGDLGALSGGGLDFALTAHRYFSLHHGGILGFEVQGLGGGNADALLPAMGGEVAAGPELTDTRFFLGYAFRYFLTDRLALVYALAPGLDQLAYSRVGRPEQEVEYAFSVNQRLALDWCFARSRDLPFGDLDQSVGAVLAHAWLPSASIGPVSATGHGLALLARYKLGF